MDYKLVTLPNKLRILTVPMPRLQSATVAVWVKTGSRMEEKRVNGISHFLEHMVFKGSKKRPTAREIAEAVDAIGAEFNAGTSKDWTNFYIKARPESMDTAFDVLADMVLNPLLKEEEIEREKGVIVEEIAMYEDTPMYRIGDIFEQLIFEGNSLGWDIAGTVETVKGVKRNDFVRYRKSHYYADNMLVAVAGRVENGDILGLAEKYFGGLESRGANEKTKMFRANQNAPKLKLHPKKKEQAHFILGFLGEGRDYKGRYAQGVLSAILGGGMSSRLFSEVRERRGLAYLVRTSVERYAETGYVGTHAGVDVKRVDEAIKVVLDEHYKLASGANSISDKELSKAKEYIKGHLALSLEDTKNVNSFFASDELLLKRIRTPKEEFERINQVTTEDVLKEAKKLFVPEKLNLAIIGPYEEASRFEKLLE